MLSFTLDNPAVLTDNSVRLIAKAIAKLTAGWSSPVAREAHNLEVVGSNPAPATCRLSANRAFRRLEAFLLDRMRVLKCSIIKLF